jgi:hypothetical protein
MSMDSGAEPGSLPHFHLTEVYPDPAAIFAISVPSLAETKDRALIVLDTNVLLLPFTVDPKSVEEIRRTYKRLAKAGRLFVPAQVAREFAKNRAAKIGEVYQRFSRERSKVAAPQMDRYPLLESLTAFRELRDLQKQLEDQVAEYRRKLGGVLDSIRAWRWDDPVSSMYREIFTKGVVVAPQLSNEDVVKDLRRRLTNRIPPGYKDAGKSDEGVGDLLIWHTILRLGRERKQDLIFVSGDEKADWWHQSEKEALYPRFELVNEYWSTSEGKAFQIVKFSQLLELFGAKEDLVSEVQQEERVQEKSPQARGHGSSAGEMRRRHGVPKPSRRHLLRAIEDFDSTLRPDPRWQQWHARGRHKYAIAYSGRLYPVKKIISLATGVPTGAFSGGYEANRLLMARGFEVVELRERSGSGDEQENEDT